MRPSGEIERELEDLREGLCQMLGQKFALEFIDLEYIALEVNSLKRELQIAKAKENCQ